MKKERERNALWIPVVIDSAFGCVGPMISPHLLKNKIDKDNFREKHSKTKKKPYEKNTVAIHNNL